MSDQTRVVGTILLTAWACVACRRAGGAAGDAGAGEPATAAVAVEEPKAGEEGEVPVVTGDSEVTLDGVYHAHPPLQGVGTQYALRFETRVFAKADASSARLGQLRAGARVATRGRVVAGEAVKGCEGGFVPIQPTGFVCKSDLTDDANHPIVLALGGHPADASQKLPYMYGTVKRGGPAYGRIPSADDIAKLEPNLARHLEKWRTDEESGAPYGQDLWLRGKDVGKTPSVLDALERRVSDELPVALRGDALLPNPTARNRVREGAKIGEVSFRNGVSFVDTFLVDGRRYGLSTEMEVMPVDRFRPIRGSDYHGVRIGVDVEFPFALVRVPGRKFQKVEGSSVKTAGEMPYRGVLPLTGKQQFFNGVLHYETKDGLWADDRSVSRLDPAKKMPGWALAGEKWLDINVTKQVVMAYEGQTPVYATLMSSGADGLGDPETSRATKRGIFRIHTKYRASTMSSKLVGEEFELRDVPYVQYFEGGYALHAAYWHDMFGTPKSHGCINLAPEDARRIFFWTEPQVPVGWHGAARATTGTVVFVHQ